MHYYMYSVFDSKAGAFLTPFFMSTEGMALRAVSDMVKDPKSMFHRHADDFSLYQMGEFEDTTGVIVAQHPQAILNLVSFQVQQGDGNGSTVSDVSQVLPGSEGRDSSEYV